MFKSRTIFEMARGARITLGLDAFVTRGEAPDAGKRLAAQAEETRQTHDRVRSQELQLARLRERVAALQTELESRDAGDGRATEDPLAALLQGTAGSRAGPLEDAARKLREEIRIARETGGAPDRFRALAGERGLKVHLGCGPDVRPGWVNVDLTPVHPPETYTDATFIAHDLRLGLPLEEGSCDFVYSSHFFEHLEYEQGLRLLGDCLRVLRPGGTLRLALPNLRALFEAYLEGNDGFFDLLDPYLLSLDGSGTKTRIDYINFAVYQSGEHKHIFDEEKLETVLLRLGFGSVAASPYREDVDSDLPVRRKYSFYVEATK